ncbi:hypothetical protein MMC21_002474 [Puttea exsequens]|nr:hypothetical protein [Puttea exsequens]
MSNASKRASGPASRAPFTNITNQPGGSPGPSRVPFGDITNAAVGTSSGSSTTASKPATTTKPAPAGPAPSAPAASAEQIAAEWDRKTQAEKEDFYLETFGSKIPPWANDEPYDDFEDVEYEESLRGASQQN